MGALLVGLVLTPALLTVGPVFLTTGLLPVGPVFLMTGLLPVGPVFLTTGEALTTLVLLLGTCLSTLYLGCVLGILRNTCGR